MNANVKRLCLIFLMISSLSSCFKDDVQIEYAKVYLPLAARATDGVFNASFKQSADTSFIVGAYCSGSIMTPEDVSVQMALAVEEFEAEMIGNVGLADYSLLPEECYQIEPSDLNVKIKSGTERADIKIRFFTSLFETGRKYILPIKLESVSKYEIADTYNVLYFGVTAN